MTCKVCVNIFKGCVKVNVKVIAKNMIKTLQKNYRKTRL